VLHGRQLWKAYFEHSAKVITPNKFLHACNVSLHTHDPCINDSLAVSLKQVWLLYAAVSGRSSCGQTASCISITDALCYGLQIRAGHVFTRQTSLHLEMLLLVMVRMPRTGIYPLTSSRGLAHIEVCPLDVQPVFDGIVPSQSRRKSYICQESAVPVGCRSALR
jgi:hypothetical protein